MGNNLRQFAFEFTATKEQAKFLMDMIYVIKRYEDGEIAIGDIAGPFDQFCEMSDLCGMDFDISFDDNRDTVFIASGGYGNIALVAELIKNMMVKFDRDDVIRFTWADTCTSPRIDEFHGGAIAVTREKILELSTYDIMKWDIAAWETR